MLIPQFWYALDKGLLRRPLLLGDQPPTQVFDPPDNITWLRGTATASADAQIALLDRLLDDGSHPGRPPA